MKLDEIIIRLRQWEKVHAQVNEAYEALTALTGSCPEAKLQSAIWAGFEAYTALMAETVGDDTNESLSWYCWDNNMGADGKEAGLKDGETRPIRTVEDLAWLITT